MELYLIISLIAGIYIAGWFGTALVITQVGEVKRGCAPGCTIRRKMDYMGDPVYLHGSHAPECNKPRLDLIKASDAAIYAVAWPYVIFHSALLFSEFKARSREERKTAAKRPVDTDALDAVLYDERKMLEES